MATYSEGREALEHIGKAVSESFIDSLILKYMGCTDEHIDWFLDGGAADSQRLQYLIYLCVL